jgi:tripartite-type tricarboxylate transporter receptor subunit TctC
MSCISILISGLALTALSPAFAVPVAAQQLPPRPIRVVVPFSPAGFPDRIARVLANEWSETLRQRVYVENKPGAGGMIGTAEAARAEPDGTTLVISSMPTLVLAPLINARSDFRPMEDFSHIIYIGGPPNAFVVASTSKIRSFDDFARIAKDTPQSYGTAGVGTVGHLTAAYVAQKAHLKLTHVPYNGPMLGDILSGVLDFGSLTASTVMGGIDGGELRALVVGTDKRLSKYPDLPTFKELGFDISPIAWMALSGPAGMSRELQASLSEQFSGVLARPKVKAILQQELIEPIAMSPQELTAFVQSDIKTWAPIIDAVGLRK